MTVGNSSSRATYAGSGAATPYPVPFRFLSSSDIRVERRDITGAQTSLALGPDFNVTGAGSDAGGTLTLARVLAIGETLAIHRRTTRDQQIKYVPNDPFPAKTHELGLDKLTMIAQDVDDEAAADRADMAAALERTLRTPAGETVPLLPARSARTGFAAWDAASGGLVGVSVLPGLAAAAAVVMSSRALMSVLVTPSAGQPVQLTEPGREGLFIWKAGNFAAQVANDPLQGVFVASASNPTGSLGAWVRAWQGFAQASWFGIVPGVATPAAWLEQAILVAKRIEIGIEGDYLLERTLALGGARVALRGIGWGVRLISGNPSNVFIGNGDGITLDNLTLHSTGYGDYGQIVTFHTNITNLLITRINFTNTGALSGQCIKLVNDFASVGVINFEISHCEMACGAMGIELQNHGTETPITYRFQNGKIRANKIRNAGSVFPTGMGISMSGQMLNIQVVDNLFENCSTCGVEMIGCQYTQVDSNVFKDCTGTAVSATNYRAMYGCSITNNRTEGGCGGMLLYSFVEGIIAHNQMYVQYPIVCKGDRNLFYGNMIEASGSAIVVDNGVDSVVFGNYLVGGSGLPCVSIYSAGSNRNKVFSNVLVNTSPAAVVEVAGWWTGDSTGTSTWYGNTRVASAQGRTDVEQSEFLGFVPSGLAIVGIPGRVHQGRARWKGYTGAAGFTLQCEATAGGQPYAMFKVRWWGRVNNLPACGEVMVGFGSFADPAAGAVVTSIGAPITVASQANNGKANVSVTFQATAGLFIEMEAIAGDSASLEQFRWGAVPGLT